MSLIQSKFLEYLLAFPADTLDKKTIQYIFDMYNNTLSTPTIRKSKSKDENKPKRELNNNLGGFNAYWKIMKSRGMTRKDFIEMWKSMADDRKEEVYNIHRVSDK